MRFYFFLISIFHIPNTLFSQVQNEKVDSLNFNILESKNNQKKTSKLKYWDRTKFDCYGHSGLYFGANVALMTSNNDWFKNNAYLQLKFGFHAMRQSFRFIYFDSDLQNGKTSTKGMLLVAKKGDLVFYNMASLGYGREIVHSKYGYLEWLMAIGHNHFEFKDVGKINSISFLPGFALGVFSKNRLFTITLETNYKFDAICYEGANQVLYHRSFWVTAAGVSFNFM